MHVIRVSATATSDGILRLTLPVGEAGEYEVVVTASPKKKGAAVAAKKGSPSPADIDAGLGWNVYPDDAGKALDDTLFGDGDGDKKPDPLGGFS